MGTAFSVFFVKTFWKPFPIFWEPFPKNILGTAFSHPAGPLGSQDQERAFLISCIWVVRLFNPGRTESFDFRRSLFQVYIIYTVYLSSGKNFSVAQLCLENFHFKATFFRPCHPKIGLKMENHCNSFAKIRKYFSYFQNSKS